jgi:hypothetical protein
MSAKSGRDPVPARHGNFIGDISVCILRGPGESRVTDSRAGCLLGRGGRRP